MSKITSADKSVSKGSKGHMEYNHRHATFTKDTSTTVDMRGGGKKVNHTEAAHTKHASTTSSMPRGGMEDMAVYFTRHTF